MQQAAEQDFHEPLGVQLTRHSQTFYYIVFAAGVCSDQKRRNQCDPDVFFLKEKQKGGQKSDGLCSSLLESEESGVSYAQATVI